MTGGTFTSWTSGNNGQTTFTLTGISVTVAAGSPFVESGNSQGFLGYVIRGNDNIGGSGFADHLIGYTGNDTVDAGVGNDTLRYTSALDGQDVIVNFDGDALGGQDLFNLDGLFDALGVAAANRAARVSLTPGAGTVDTAVDTDGDLVFDLMVATLHTTDTVTLGADVILGT